MVLSLLIIRNAYRGSKTTIGYIYQDVRAPDKLHEPRLGELPQYSWQNRVATTYNARRTGNLFLPLPGGYQLSPGESPRGGNTPVVTDIEPGTVGVNQVNQLFGASKSNSLTGKGKIHSKRMY